MFLSNISLPYLSTTVAYLEKYVIVPEVTVDECPQFRVTVPELLVQRLGVRHFLFEPPREVLLARYGLEN